MNVSLRNRLSCWDSFLFFWSLILLAFALGLAALDYIEWARWCLWTALAAFVGAKLCRVVEVTLLMKEGDVVARLYVVIVNLALGAAAAYILADLIMKYQGIVFSDVA